MKEDRSVIVGRDAVGNVITTGDRAKVRAKIDAKLVRTVLPSADSIDLSKELAEIRVILDRIGGEHAAKMGRALDDAAEETEKAEPKKDEIGAAINRALEYAKKSNGFADEVGKLAPHVTNAVAWLGTNWQQLLSVVGLSG
jgi:hypothetical protein